LIALNPRGSRCAVSRHHRIEIMSIISNRAIGAFCFAISALSASQALAHATLEKQEAAVGSPYKAVMRVPHGCAGAATIRVRVRIPEGMVGVKPMPKPGWTLETAKGPYSKTYELFHAKISEGVTEISWSGGRLPDDQYDEFVFAGTLADDLAPGTMLYFPTVQDCETGAERWIEIPADGKSARDLKAPAPGLLLTSGKPQ
jgi:periplasmic copper chaperone A